MPQRGGSPHLPVDELVLDGEAVAHDADGMPDFWALRSPDKACNAVLYTFDLLMLNGKDLRPTVLATAATYWRKSWPIRSVA